MINDKATTAMLNERLQEIVTAALDAGFKVFAHKGDRRPAGFVFACLDPEGSFVTVGVPTHSWEDVQISAPVQPSKVWGSSVAVDYDGTAEGAIRAMRKVCDSPTVVPRFVKAAPATVPNHGNKTMTSWPGGVESFAEVVAAGQE